MKYQKSSLTIPTIIILLVGAVLAYGQDAPRESPGISSNQLIASGTAARLSLQTQLSSKLNEVGDRGR